MLLSAALIARYKEISDMGEKVEILSKMGTSVLNEYCTKL